MAQSGPTASSSNSSNHQGAETAAHPPTVSSSEPVDVSRGTPKAKRGWAYVSANQSTEIPQQEDAYENTWSGERRTRSRSKNNTNTKSASPASLPDPASSAATHPPPPTESSIDVNKPEPGTSTPAAAKRTRSSSNNSNSMSSATPQPVVQTAPHILVRTYSTQPSQASQAEPASKRQRVDSDSDQSRSNNGTPSQLPREQPRVIIESAKQAPQSYSQSSKIPRNADSPKPVPGPSKSMPSTKPAQQPPSTGSLRSAPAIKSTPKAPPKSAPTPTANPNAQSKLSMNVDPNREHKTDNLANMLLGKQRETPSRPSTPTSASQTKHAGTSSSQPPAKAQPSPKIEANSSSQESNNTEGSQPRQSSQGNKDEGQDSEKPGEKRWRRDSKLDQLFGSKGLLQTKFKKPEKKVEGEAAAAAEQAKSVNYSFHNFGQTYSKRAEEQAQKEESERQAQERYEGLQQDTRGMPLKQWEDFQQQREEARQRREEEMRNSRPFDLMDQSAVCGQVSNEYKVRVVHTNEKIASRPIEGRYTDDFERRWREAGDDAKPEPTQKDIVYDPPPYCVRPGVWGAFFLNHNHVEWYDPREEAFKQMLEEESEIDDLRKGNTTLQSANETTTDGLPRRPGRWAVPSAGMDHGINSPRSKGMRGSSFEPGEISEGERGPP